MRGQGLHQVNSADVLDKFSVELRRRDVKCVATPCPEAAFII
jgi:hypothetical protein